MLALALTFAVTLTLAAFALRGRRKRRSARLAPLLDPSPAGMKHLAATVLDHRDPGLHLPVGRAAAQARRHRLGALLGARQA